MTSLKRTPLYEAHRRLGARMIEFGGFELPVQYTSIREEHCAVREAAGLFPGVRTQSWDVSLSSAGPVFLEFNFGGDLNLHQLAHGSGALSDSYVEHLKGIVVVG